MSNSQSIWNGCAVHGDIKELDYIVESVGFISLNKEDILEVLSVDGKNYVVSGVNTSISKAYQNAVNKLPCKIDKVNALIIDFFCGNKQTPTTDFMATITSLANTSKDIPVKWGIVLDESLGEYYKVVIIVSVK